MSVTFICSTVCKTESWPLQTPHSHSVDTFSNHSRAELLRDTVPSAPCSEYLGRALSNCPGLHTHTHTLWSQLPYQNSPESSARLALAHQGASTGPVSHTESLLITHSPDSLSCVGRDKHTASSPERRGWAGKEVCIPRQKEFSWGIPTSPLYLPPPSCLLPCQAMTSVCWARRLEEGSMDSLYLPCPTG